METSGYARLYKMEYGLIQLKYNWNTITTLLKMGSNCNSKEYNF